MSDSEDTVRAELEAGIAYGLDPQPALDQRTEVTGEAVTRAASWWSNRSRPCRTCGQTFRRGDRVLVTARPRTVQHLDPALHCGAQPPADGPDTGPETTDRDELAAGLQATWRSAAQVTRLAEGDWRVPRRAGRPGERSPVCLYCGHTFRSGDYVIVCPCRPDAPACDAAVHRDPAAGLACWEKWLPAGGLTVCPTTGARL